MIKPFQYYINQNLVKKSIPNTSMSKSLFEKSELRFKRLNKSTVEENEASIIFEDIYECLREASQSLMEVKGFKPYSHEALISFLNEHQLLSQEVINLMDNYRILRNNSIYKAEKVSLQKCLEALKFTKEVLPKINKKLKELLNFS